eukprot:TRINITY_DN8570_c0_g1_i1.p2 TRINITY_DN8570_c0_g1~~TRINITY_DN8570_c0_g1_i1.p2  ORF type:complete len:238 (+),score=42.54 TRINITY_DN8570_c0_g1_i1:446-1159(+)
MLREVVRLANSFERPAPSAPVAWSPAVASASSAPSWTATSSASPSFSATPQPSHTSFLPPAQPSPAPAPQRPAAIPPWIPNGQPTWTDAGATMLKAASSTPQPQAADGKMVLFESAAPDPTADYYTQQYQRYLEHVKMSARTNAVYSGDYFTSGAQTARTVFPGPSAYFPQAAAGATSYTYSAAPPVPTLRQQTPTMPSYGTVYQPPQHPAYSMNLPGAPTFSYNPFAPVTQPQGRW